MQAIIDNQAILTLGLLALVALMLLVVMLRRPGHDHGVTVELAETSARLAAAEQQLHAADTGREQLRAALEGERVACGRLEAEREANRMRLSALEEQLEEESALLSERERDVAALRLAEARLTGDRDGARAECSKLAETQTMLEAKLAEDGAALKARDGELARLNADLRGMTETLRAEREKHAALTAETERNRAQFVAQFKAISGEILQNQGKAASEVQRSELEKIINPFKAEMEGLKVNLKDMTERAEKERQSLGSQLHVIQALNAKIAEEANGLTRALRGDKKMQGNWGETVLERLLEAAGLREGLAFTRQGGFTGEDGRRLIPDVILHLPGERDIVIDSKVSLNAYQDFVQAGTREAEAGALRRHIQAIRNHIRSLAEKRYDCLGTFGSVMMFLPIDEALSTAIASDHNLQLEAAEQRVHLVTPSTLMPTLALVDHLWTIDSRNRNVDEIVDRAGRLHDKFVSVVESVQKIGDHLRKASECQDEAIKRMSDGPGNVLRQVDQLRTLGAKVRKALPADLLAASDEDEPAETAELEGRSSATPSRAPALAAG